MGTMKIKLSLILIVSLFFTGCFKTLETKIERIIEITRNVGEVTIDYTGFWSNFHAEVTFDEDGNRNVYGQISGKYPMGPSLTVGIEGIKPE